MLRHPFPLLGCLSAFMVFSTVTAEEQKPTATTSTALPSASVSEVVTSSTAAAVMKVGGVDTTPKLENLNKQIQANPENAQAYSNRGYTLALLGRKEEARADIKKSVELRDNAPMHNRAGWAYFNMGDYADAVREFEASVKVSNYQAHYDYYSLVLGYWGTGETKKALENYQLAAERDPRLGSYKTLAERTAEWTPLEQRAMHEIYILWSKAWR